LLKPNVSTLVGSLYDPGDTRRDAGFSIFYMGINLGAFIGPLVAGWLAQRVDWHLGFASAGVGMTLGLIQYVLGRQRLQPAIERLVQIDRPAASVHAVSTGTSPMAAVASPGTPGGAPGPNGVAEQGQPGAGSWGFTPTEWKRLGAIVIFFVVAILFWGAYEQAGSTLNLFADRYTRLELLGFSFPSSWFQSVQPIFVILLAPVFAWLWVRLGAREPSVPAKFAIGVLFMGIAFLVLVPAGTMAQGGSGIRVSPWWLIVSYGVSEIGELCLSPVGLSVVTKLAPVRIVGLMMGVWFLSNAFGNKLAGWAASFFSTMPLDELFGEVALILLVATLVMFALLKPIRRLMGGVS